MAATKIYVPVYMTGSNGKKAFQWAVVSATLDNNKVPEGQTALKSSAMDLTPPADLQPEP